MALAAHIADRYDSGITAHLEVLTRKEANFLKMSHYAFRGKERKRKAHSVYICVQIERHIVARLQIGTN